jgi:hypothetical protein
VNLLMFGECRWCGGDATICLPTTRSRGRPLVLCRACFAVRCFRRRWAIRLLMVAAVVGAIVEELGRHQ